MQVRDNDTQLLYGFFQSISSWALEKGYRDVSRMKNLLKLAMIDVCRQRHAEKPALAAQMAVVADLGISLRNVQYALKTLDELSDFSTEFVKIREIQKEITVVLLKKPQTVEEIFAEVSYLIHAPYELQKRTLRTILQDMEQKGIITCEVENGKTYYKTVEHHVNLFDPSDLPARISGLLTQIDAFNHTVGQPYFQTRWLDPDQARGLQKAANEFLRGTGNAYEYECRENDLITKPYYFYLGSAPTTNPDRPISLPDAILEVIRARFADPDSPSILRNHWYHLTPASAQAVFDDVRHFIEREGESAGPQDSKDDAIPFTLYFGLADRQSGILREEI